MLDGSLGVISTVVPIGRDWAGLGGQKERQPKEGVQASHN